MIGTLLLLLVWVLPARALDWWVPDEAAAAGVRAALGAVWADAEVEVKVGPWPGFGIGSDDDRLWVVADGVDRDEVAPRDPVTRVVLMRAWMRVPARPMTAAAVPPPARPPVVRQERWVTAIGGRLGPAFGVSTGAPPLAFAVTAGGAWRQLLLGGSIDGGAAGVLPSEAGSPLAHQRVGALALVGLRAPLWGGELEVEAGLGARLLTLAVPGAAAVTVQPVVSLGERLFWWREVAGPWGFGLGLRVDLDDPRLPDKAVEMRTSSGASGEVGSTYVALEVGLRRRWLP